MTENNIKVYRVKRKISQIELAHAMDEGVTNVVVGFIESGKALPTKIGLEAMCRTLKATPEQLYKLEDLQLASVSVQLEQGISPISKRLNSSRNPRSDRGHKGKIEFRTWLTPFEKSTLEDAVKQLGYRSSAEWFREMRRNTIARLLRLQGKESGKVIPMKQNPLSAVPESNSLLSL